MAPRTFSRCSRTAAPIEAVWPLIGEARRWREWSFLDRSELESEGDPAPDGVGAVRAFTRNGVGSKEEVLAWDPPHHLAYAIISGFPVRNYRADVVLTSEPPSGDATGGGTTVTWSVRFEPQVPGTGLVMAGVLCLLIQGFCSSVCRHADRQVEAGAGGTKSS
jgi:uncharacterized protein YndB with AHSA1/START domain